MNGRIKQLAIEARLIVAEQNGFDPTRLSMSQQRFAELIVKECAQVGGPEDSYTDEWFKAKADSVAKIKQYFGVE
jgi:hypothetical protein